MPEASEEGTAQGYNEGRSLFTSSYCAALPSATWNLLLLTRRQVCVKQVPLTTTRSGDDWPPLKATNCLGHSGVASVTSHQDVALERDLNFLLLGALATWNLKPCCCGNWYSTVKRFFSGWEKQRWNKLPSFAGERSLLYLHFSELEMDWRRAGKTIRNKETSSGVRVKRIKLLNSQIRSETKIRGVSVLLQRAMQWNYCRVSLELSSRLWHLPDGACVLPGRAWTSPDLSSCLWSPGGDSKAAPKTYLEMQKRGKQAGKHSSSVITRKGLVPGSVTVNNGSDHLLQAGRSYISIIKFSAWSLSTHQPFIKLWLLAGHNNQSKVIINNQSHNLISCDF